MREEKEVFFFEKKNQKTFAYGVRHLGKRSKLDAGRNGKKFFGSFFQKRTLPFFLLLPVAAHADQLRGRVERLTPGGTQGWACAADGSATTYVSVYAGDRLLGEYPTTVQRPDVGRNCPGAGPHGFSIRFGQAGRALFSGQTRLSVFASVPGVRPRLLPAGQRASNPLALPAGALAGLNPAGRVTGKAADAAGQPVVGLFAGGPPGVGVAGKRRPAHGRAGGKYEFNLPLPANDVAPGAGAVLPVFGVVADPRGAAAPLSRPLALIPDGTGRGQMGVAVPMRARVAQSANLTGVRNTLFTAWLPAGTGFAGLSGTVSLAGSVASFSEALVELATTGDSQASCAAENGAMPNNPPALSRLWAGILKTNDTRRVEIPVDFALPFAVPGASTGTCLMAWFSAGYPFLVQGPAQTTITAARLDVTAVPTQSGSARVVPFGVGGEFHFPGTSPAAQSVYVGIQADVALNVDGIAGTASAAPVAGAPQGSGWLPLAAGAWSAATNFYYMPQAVCAAANFKIQPSIGILSVLRNGTPGSLTVPRGAVPVLQMPIFSADGQAVQQSSYQAFGPGTHFTGALAVGDCLVAYDTVSAQGVLDVENQSTVYLRVLPGG